MNRDYEGIAGLLHGLLIRLDDRLPHEVATEVAEYIDHNELGVALECMAEALSEGRQPVSAHERADMLALVDRMEMDDLVPRAPHLLPGDVTAHQHDRALPVRGMSGRRSGQRSGLSMERQGVAPAGDPVFRDQARALAY